MGQADFSDPKAAKLRAEGRTSSEIAQILGTAPPTVDEEGNPPKRTRKTRKRTAAKSTASSSEKS